MDSKYTQYDVLAFAQDPDFIQWVKSADAKRTEDWENWLESHPEKLKEVEAAKALVTAIRFQEKAVTEEQIKSLWQKIDAGIDATPVFDLKNRKSISWIAPLVAVAAAVVLLVLFFLPEEKTIVETAYAERLVETLPDNSSVALNAGSAISYMASDWDKERLIELKGEAFFEVEKGAPFIVETDQGQVKVLGTSFNIDAHHGLRVECYTGKVEVTVGGQAYILTPNKGVRLSAESGLIDTFEVMPSSQEAFWREGSFSYVETPFYQVIEEIERQYDVSVEFEDSLRNKKTRTNFSSSDKIDSTLKKVGYLYNLNVIRKNDKEFVLKE